MATLFDTTDADLFILPNRTKLSCLLYADDLKSECQPQSSARSCLFICELSLHNRQYRRARKADRLYKSHTCLLLFILLPRLLLLYLLKMSDESSDPDLAEERYDPEDNLNAYGSPVFRPPDDININEIVEQSDVGIVHPVRAQVSTVTVHINYMNIYIAIFEVALF